MPSNQEKWDLRFLEMADLVASWSKDPSTKCGAVIVRDDRTVASVGYNGFSRNMVDREEDYSNREVKYEKIIHGEVNALIHCAEKPKGYTLYTTGPCCNRCAVQMLQAGITRFVSWTAPDMEARWGEAFKKTFSYYDEAGVNHKEYETIS